MLQIKSHCPRCGEHLFFTIIVEGIRFVNDVTLAIDASAAPVEHMCPDPTKDQIGIPKSSFFHTGGVV